MGDSLLFNIMNNKSMKYLDLYKLLKKTNCRDCGLPTCMAFAHAVINSEKNIDDCPHIDKNVAEGLKGKTVRRDRENELESLIAPLRNAVSSMDLTAVADGLGATVTGNGLCINCLGKDFLVDANGNIESNCHIHSWITMPLLSYIKACGKPRIAGKWVSFEELHNGITMYNFFNRRCIEPLKQIADLHNDIFFDLLDIFGGQKTEEFSSDHSRIIYPLPRVPFLILYWSAEDNFDSNIKVLFDSTADIFLDVDSIYILGRGIVEMFKKIIAKHEELVPALLAL